jgi:hypothetical protein
MQQFGQPVTAFALVSLALLASRSLALAAEPIELTFSGRVDGYGTIRVAPREAEWKNYAYATPTEVKLNGHVWNPAENSKFKLEEGPALVPASLRRMRANIIRTSGRDSIAAEIQNNRLLIHVDDTIPGDDLYEFKVVLTPQPLRPKTETVSLRLRGRFDGSDRVVIGNSAASLLHLQWGPPQELKLNDLTWDPLGQPTLVNDGATRYLPADVDYGSVKFTKHAGRGLASYEVFDERVEIIIADNDLGDDLYDVTLEFQKLPAKAEKSRSQK